MIKVSILYPNNEGCKFDLDYYTNTHIPMTEARLSAALRGVTIEKGLSSGAPGSQPTYIAAGHLLFDSVEAFQEAIAPHAQELMADIPNYTNVQPVVQISEITVSR
ncbi:MAG: EthD family reductase [Acidobacteriota bacterium]